MSEAHRLGGIKAAIKIKAKYGDDFYSRNGRLGGRARVKKGFGCMPPEKVAAAGKLGGQRSRRGISKLI